MGEVASARPDLGDTFDLELGPYLISAATAYGPRVTGLRRRGGPELLARLGDEVVIERADSGTYRFRGGHRLWAAPELPMVTYAPDDHPCEVMTTTNGLSIRGPLDRAGLIKEIALTPEDERLLVDHTLTNAGSGSLSVAPWGITQFRLGGVALIPTGGLPASPGPQADRSLILWPYTNPADPRLSWREQAVLVHAVAGPQFKIGSGPRPGRLGYFIDRHLFTKDIPSAGPGVYPDRGAIGQLYLNDAFCELESVGAITTLEPGASVSHREVWSIEECPDVETAYLRTVGAAAR
jgi:hypothetical protein